MYCTRCGNKIPDNSSTCSYCGYKIDVSESNIYDVVPVEKKDKKTPKNKNGNKSYLMIFISFILIIFSISSVIVTYILCGANMYFYLSLVIGAVVCALGAYIYLTNNKNK